MLENMEEIVKIVVDYFSKKEGLVAVVLFGSYATGVFHGTSDVDLAILYRHEHIPSIETIIDMREDLNNRLNKDVDLVCLNITSPILGMQVYKHGKELLICDQKEFGKYLMRLFNEYVELKVLRKPMEEALLDRKIS